MTPRGAKAFRIELPCSAAFVTGLRFTGDISVRRKGHSEFGAGWRCGREGLTREEGSPNLARRHRLGG